MGLLSRSERSAAAAGSVRRELQFVWLVIWMLIIFNIVGHCHSSRTRTHVFKMDPAGSSVKSGHFLGFLPRRVPIPASGPSRKHNDIGPQSWRSP